MDSFNHTWLKIEKVAIVEERARQGRELQSVNLFLTEH